jgi:hypothetical protein
MPESKHPDADHRADGLVFPTEEVPIADLMLDDEVMVRLGHSASLTMAK